MAVKPTINQPPHSVFSTVRIFYCAQLIIASIRSLDWALAMAGEAGGMNPEYLSRLQSILYGAQPHLQRVHDLQFKAVFGAVAAYVDGRIFVSFGKFGLALKFPPERCAALIAEGSAGPLRYFPKGHIKKNYAVLPERTIDDSASLRELMNESIGYVTHRPAQ